MSLLSLLSLLGLLSSLWNLGGVQQEAGRLSGGRLLETLKVLTRSTDDVLPNISDALDHV
jgi:hypothetical protein